MRFNSVPVMPFTVSSSEKRTVECESFSRRVDIADFSSRITALVTSEVKYKNFKSVTLNEN